MDTLGPGPGLIASKVVRTTGEGTVVDILLRIVGAVAGSWLFEAFGGTAVTAFDIDSFYNVIAAIMGAVLFLVLYHLFFRRRML